jgi:hypothetical protein
MRIELFDQAYYLTGEWKFHIKSILDHNDTIELKIII